MESLAQTFSKKDVGAAALAEFQGMVTDAKTAVEAIPWIEKICEATAAKDKEILKNARECLSHVFQNMTPWALSAALPQIKKGLDGKAKPDQKDACLDVVEMLAKKEPRALGKECEWLVHPIGFLMTDIKKSVKAKACTVMGSIAACSGNNDLVDFIPTIVEANESLKKVKECVEKLAGCIFVQNVEAPHLAVITPVLWRGLNEKSEQTIRRCCVIVDNMCKLVDDPREGRPLLAEIRGLIEKKCEEISDPEAREMAEKTRDTINKIAEAEPKPEADTKEIFMKHGVMPASWSEAQMEFVQVCVNAMNKQNVSEDEEWVKTFVPVLGCTEAQILAVKKQVFEMGEVKVEEFIDEDESAPDLYKGSFSLAYGTLTLLRDTKLHLKKFKFYGMLGPNNCGKTTLMRAISREQVEGFPKRDELVTIFVEHEVEEREILPPGKHDGVEWPLGKFNIDLSGIEFVVDTCNNSYGKSVTMEAAEEELGVIGFKNPVTGVNPRAAAGMLNPITTYSGGWKVKMQLCCAKLINADILMLDEPTGHLDVKNIEWMKEWLNNFPGSIIATSANSSFLDEMCTHIIDFSERKLVQFKHEEKGKVLTHFVEKYPEKKSYFELSNKKQKFIFPQPGPLEGVKSKGRSILKMTGVSFRYPVHEKPTVKDISLSVCMLSRVGVVGPNGAGKSTAIKLLIGELKAEEGTVWKHSGLRMAYVAQHAFHHLEKHLTKTPVQYVLWRFAGNDDRESLENQTKEINVDEEALRAVKWCVDSKSGVVRKVVPGEKGDHPVTPDTIQNRRKNKQKKYEYEVKWMHKPIELACWVERDTMLAMGYEKLVCREDEKQAAAAGLMSKPLTAPSVEKALKDFGLDNESASHNPIASLSGGQKVKVVLAAAMWQNPHILILDEPTNYLDRDGLGALALGLQEFGGGVVIISHNMEFTDSITQQKWVMRNEEGSGRLREEGELAEDEAFGGNDAGDQDEIKDGAGNVIKVDKTKLMNPKELKKAIKELEKILKEHKKKNTLSEAEMWEKQDKLGELKTQLEAAKDK